MCFNAFTFRVSTLVKFTISSFLKIVAFGDWSVSQAKSIRSKNKTFFILAYLVPQLSQSKNILKDLNHMVLNGFKNTL